MGTSGRRLPIQSCFHGLALGAEKDQMGWGGCATTQVVVSKGGWSPGCLGLGMCEWCGNLSTVLFLHVSTCLSLNGPCPALIPFALLSPLPGTPFCSFCAFPQPLVL